VTYFDPIYHNISINTEPLDDVGSFVS